MARIVIRNSPANSGAGMSIKEAFDAVNENFRELYDDYIVGQINDAVQEIEAVFAGGTITNAVNILDSTSSTDSTTGALVVNGGVGIDGDVNIGGSISVANITASGNIQAQQLTASEITADSLDISTVTSQGNLNINASAAIAGDLSVQGDVVFNGAVNGTTRWVNGNMLMDIGYGIDQASRLVGNVVVAGPIESTGIGTGSLKSNGGASIAGNLYVGKTATFLGNVSISNSYTPTGPSSAGSPGQISWDNGNLYVCVAQDTWVRFTADTSGAW